MSLDEKLIGPLPSRERILGTSTSLIFDRGGDGSLGEVAIAHYVPTGTLELIYHLSHLYLKSGSDQMPSHERATARLPHQLRRRWAYPRSQGKSWSAAISFLIVFCFLTDIPVGNPTQPGHSPQTFPVALIAVVVGKYAPPLIFFVRTSTHKSGAISRYPPG